MDQMEAYRAVAGSEQVDRVQRKADLVQCRRLAHVNATKDGGGVATLLHSFVPLMREAGLDARWSEIAAPHGFFDVTKKIHNALQGNAVEIRDSEWQLFHRGAALESEAAVDGVERLIVHDPQPLPLMDEIVRGARAIWCCHLDLSAPRRSALEQLSRYLRRFEVTVYSADFYKQGACGREDVIMPAIDPFAEKNIHLEPEEADRILESYGVPLDLPLVAQISRYDRAKDPLGVVDAAKQARSRTEFRLVLLGNVAADDPEGEEVRAEVRERQDEHTLVLDDPGDPRLVNALQRRADVVLQKSMQEGFGLTVAEAMWKGTPVIGGAVGGIRLQIADGENGYLVSSADQAAARIVDLLEDPGLRTRLGEAGRQSVRNRFLMIRYLEDWLDLLLDLEAQKRVS